MECTDTLEVKVPNNKAKRGETGQETTTAATKKQYIYIYIYIYMKINHNNNGV